MSIQMIIEPSTIGLSEKAHATLTKLKEDGFFAEMLDGYRFGISLALSKNIIPEEITGSKQTTFNIGSLDSDKSIYKAIKLLIDTKDVPVYRWAERLAEWGVLELGRQAEAGDIDFSEIINQAQNG